MNRGGSWNNNAANLRSANRNRNTPSNRNNNLGFRVVSTELSNQKKARLRMRFAYQNSIQIFQTGIEYNSIKQKRLCEGLVARAKIITQPSNFPVYFEMLTKIFTLRFNELTDSFDDAPLQEFIKNKEVLSLRDHFFMRHEVPYLAVIVSYNLPSVEQPKTDGKKERDESWRELLTPEDMPIFNAMRDWRNETSRRQGIAPYIICTNRQLSEIVHKRVSSKNQLAQIEGIGKAKIENYGDDIISLMTEKMAETSPKTQMENTAETESKDDRPAAES